MHEPPQFGTSGLRGLATTLLAGEAERHGTAFLRALAADAGALLVGRDLRASSADLVAAVARGAGALGVEVLDCGEVPTPALALESQRLGLPAIMVTGSHIPADRNGLKFYVGGEEINKAGEAAILAALRPTPEGAPGRTIDLPGVAGRYLDRYAEVIAPGALAGRRVGVCQHSSVMRDLLLAALGPSGATLVPLGRSRGFVAVDTEALGLDEQTRLAAWVDAEKLDVVVSTDGDADRPLIIDDRGRQVRGDLIGALTARSLAAQTIVTPVTSNSGIEATGWFADARRTRVGSPHVIAAMQAVPRGQVVVGFEANGGVLLGSDARLGGASLRALPTRDALLPILAVLSAAGPSLAGLVDEAPMLATASGRLQDVPRDRMAWLMTRLRDEPDLAGRLLAPLGTIAEVNDVDGLRYRLGAGEIVHIRPSGNAPELRCYTEAATPDGAAAMLERALTLLRAAIDGDRP